MSEMLPVWYTTQWRNTTIHKYQQRGFLLRPFVMPPHEVMGEKLVFRLLDKMSAERDVGRGETVKENNPTMSKVELDTKKTRVGFLVDEDDLVPLVSLRSTGSCAGPAPRRSPPSGCARGGPRAARPA